MVTRGVQIPLRGEAIQVTVAGPKAVDAEISRVLEQILRTLQGQSSLDFELGRKLSPAERIVSGMKAVFCLAVTIAIAVLIAKAVTARFRKKNESET